MFEIFIFELKRSLDFKGKTSRKNFWTFVLINLIITTLISGLSSFLNLLILAQIFNLVMFVPSIAISVRRMHDVNKHPLFILVPFYNLYLFLQKGI